MKNIFSSWSIFFVAGLCFSYFNVSTAQESVGLQTLEIKFDEIDHFEPNDRNRDEFGELRYLGGFELESENKNFGAISGVHSLENGKRIVAVSDTGYWFSWLLETSEDNTLISLSDAQFAPILDGKGLPYEHKWQVDAESLTYRKHNDNAEFLVAFEGNNRISSWAAPISNAAASSAKIFESELFGKDLQKNRGIEALTVAPPDSAISGAIVALTEQGVNESDNMIGWLIGGPNPGQFTVERKYNYDITDAAFLKNGDLLILERRFHLISGIGMRIRQIAGNTIKPNAVLDGKNLIEANWGYQIDNMEALDVHCSNDDKVILTLMSDDNQSSIQRTLLLRFELIGSQACK